MSPAGMHTNGCADDFGPRHGGPHHDTPHHHPEMGSGPRGGRDWSEGPGPEGFGGRGRRGGGPMGPMGPGPGMGHGRGHGRGRVRRGAIRLLVLSALTERPMHGYEVINVLGERSGGRWRPSAGSVYPTLQSFEDEGLVTSEEVEGKRVYSLTDAGRAAANAQPAPEPWTEDEEDDRLRQVAQGLMAAVQQVELIGSDPARTAAYDVLDDARRRLYRLLADDEPGRNDPADADDSDAADEQE